MHNDIGTDGNRAVERIRNLNDETRRLLRDGRMFITRGITALAAEEQAAILDRVRAFDEFTPENDPHGEHDFGSFEHAGHSVFWKIDYYDRDEEYGSPDPSDPSLTTRVLTVLLAEEY